MADRHVPGQGPELVLVEDLGDQSAIPHDRDVTALAGGYAGRFLAAMLKRVQTEVGQAGHVVSGGKHTEDTAFVTRSLAVQIDPLSQRSGHHSLEKEKGAGVLPALAE